MLYSDQIIQDVTMLITQDPTEEKIQELIKLSEMKAAKWLKDTEDGHIYYWPDNWTTHAQMADQLQIKDYEKGIVT